MSRNEAVAGKPPSRSLWQAAFNRLQPPTKEELESVLHWQRQAIALICGIIWGIVPLTGVVGNVSFIVVLVISAWLYYNVFLGIDVEEYGGHGMILQQGFMPAFGLFLALWIISFNLNHVKSLE